MRSSTRDPRRYELMTVLSPDVPEEELTTVLDRISTYVGSAGGTVLGTSRESPWGRRRLAYPIRHDGRDVRDGYFTLYNIELDPARVVDVERDLKLNDRVIRYLLTHAYQKTAAAAEATGETPVEADSAVVPQADGAIEDHAATAGPEATGDEGASVDEAASAEAPAAAELPGSAVAVESADTQTAPPTPTTGGGNDAEEA